MSKPDDRERSPQDAIFFVRDRCFCNKLKLYPNIDYKCELTNRDTPFYACNCHTSALKYENYWEIRRMHIQNMCLRTLFIAVDLYDVQHSTDGFLHSVMYNLQLLLKRWYNADTKVNAPL